MSVLRLERHFFTKVIIQSNPLGKAETPSRVVANVRVAEAQDDESRFQATLHVQLESAPEVTYPSFYGGEIEIVGFFRVSRGFEGDKGRLVHCHGATILYGAVREMICNITSRGPSAMLTIPTLNFSAKPAKVGKPARRRVVRKSRTGADFETPIADRVKNQV